MVYRDGMSDHLPEETSRATPEALFHVHLISCTRAKQAERYHGYLTVNWAAYRRLQLHSSLDTVSSGGLRSEYYNVTMREKSTLQPCFSIESWLEPFAFFSQLQVS